MDKIKFIDGLFFDYTHERQIGDSDFELVEEYSANIEVELDSPILCQKKRFIIQVSGLEDECHAPSIPDPSANLCGLYDQDFAYKHFDAKEIWKLIESQLGFENNFGFLEEKLEKANTFRVGE